MKSESYFETELILTPETRPKSREISLLVMLTLLIYGFCSFEVFVPIPTGIIALYIFKDFKFLAGKALMMTNVLYLIEVLAFFNAFLIFNLIYSVLTDGICVKVCIAHNFKFTDRAMFDIGGWSNIPLLFLIIPFSVSSASFIIQTPAFANDMIFSLLFFGIVFLFGFIGMGMVYVRSFEIFKTSINRIFNMDEIRLM